MWKRPALASLALGAFLAASVSSASAPPIVVFESGRGGDFRSDFDTVLFHGASSDPAAGFEVSRQDASGRWSSWVPVSVGRAPKGRFWGRAQLPLGSGPVRVRSAGAAQVFEVEAFVAGVEAPEAAFQAQAIFAVGGGTRPTVHSRQEWGAKPLDPNTAYIPHVPVKITLHHTSGVQTKTLAESEQEVRFIQDFHRNGRGWIDIGYHFLIDAQGNIFEGRPEGVVGAHVKDNNTGNIGIALLGTYHPPKNDQVAPEQLDAIVKVGRYLVARYGIDPDSLKGHRDYRDTDCPGDIAYALLDRLRVKFAEPAPAPPGVAVAPGLGSKLPGLIRRADWDGNL